MSKTTPFSFVLGKSKALAYDRLVIATGAVPVVPTIHGLDTPGVFPLHTMEDSFRVHEYLEKQSPRSAVIIGAGYIGVEVADALTHRGLKVTVVSRPRTVLPTIDPELGQVVLQQLVSRGVTVHSGLEINAIEPYNSGLKFHSKSRPVLMADLAIVATGVKPASELASAARIETGTRGAVRVNCRIEANVPGIYAAGDCVETWHCVLGTYTYLPLGTTSHKQGRVAGENAIGGDREFCGTVGTQVVKIFDLAIARTGLLDSEARTARYDPFTFETTAWDHKAYYPGAHELLVRITGDRSSGKLLGAQIVGHSKAEVAKRIDVFATALFHEMNVDELNDLDLSYTPPLGSPWDAVQVGAQAWSRALRHSQSAQE